MTSHVKASIARTLFDDFELQEYEDELKHLVRERAPETKARSMILRHFLSHIDCIK